MPECNDTYVALGGFSMVRKVLLVVFLRLRLSTEVFEIGHRRGEVRLNWSLRF